MILFLPLWVSAQDCPTGNGDNIGAAVSNGTNHQIYLEWPSEAEATTMLDALQGGALQTAISLIGVVNPGAANEEAVNINLSKSELTQPGGNPFRIRSTVPVTTNFNGNFSGTVTFNFSAAAGGGSLSCSFSVGVLPIELAYFKATPMEDYVRLEWETVVEVDNDYMVIERSIDGRSFEEVGTVQGAGYSDQSQKYVLQDRSPWLGINYYRLRQVDFDGAVTISAVEVVEFGLEKAKNNIRIYPNLLSAGQPLQIDLSQIIAGTPITMQLFDGHGRLIQTKLLNGVDTYEWPTEGLTPGIYVLCAKGLTVSQRFVIR